MNHDMRKHYLAHVIVTKPRAEIEKTWSRSPTREAKGLGKNHESHLLAPLLPASLSSHMCVWDFSLQQCMCSSSRTADEMSIPTSLLYAGGEYL
uniref:Uncharacterized protein n=1 Tax=Aegilops tauschii subsp. strangulata TaxID=200361 RepID=A0A453BV85_AEGTS